MINSRHRNGFVHAIIALPFLFSIRVSLSESFSLLRQIGFSKMDLETPKPGRFSRRFSSFLSFLLVSSTVTKPFHQPSSSKDPAHKYPESTQEQSDSDMSESKESNKDELAFRTTSSHPHQLINLSSASASSSSEITIIGEENTPSSSSSSPPLLIRHNSISATRVSREEEATSGRSDVTGASIPPYPSPSSSSSSEIFSREEATTVSSLSSKDSFPAESETTPTRRGSNNKFLRVMEIMDEQDLGKHFLGLAIPTGVGLVVSNNSLVKTTEMRMVTVTLSLAIAFIWNGLLLRKTCTKTSTLILISGAALMMLSFYSLVSCFLPSYLKWIPFLCLLASPIPFAMYGWAYFQRDKTGDLEKGDLLTTGKTAVQSHISN